MRLILYANELNEGNLRFAASLSDLAPDGALELYRDLSGLERGLRRLRYHSVVAVLLATNPESFEALMRLKALIQDLSLILVLPDRRPGTITQAHQCRPRFLTDVESDFPSEVLAVLGRMLSQMQKAQRELWNGHITGRAARSGLAGPRTMESVL